MQEGVRSELLPAVLAATESLLQAGEVFKKDDFPGEIETKMASKKVDQGGHFFFFLQMATWKSFRLDEASKRVLWVF